MEIYGKYKNRVKLFWRTFHIVRQECMLCWRVGFRFPLFFSGFLWYNSGVGKVWKWKKCLKLFQTVGCAREGAAQTALPESWAGAAHRFCPSSLLSASTIGRSRLSAGQTARVRSFSPIVTSPVYSARIIPSARAALGRRSRWSGWRKFFWNSRRAVCIISIWFLRCSSCRRRQRH